MILFFPVVDHRGCVTFGSGVLKILAKVSLAKMFSIHQTSTFGDRYTVIWAICQKWPDPQLSSWLLLFRHLEKIELKNIFKKNKQTHVQVMLFLGKFNQIKTKHIQWWLSPVKTWPQKTLYRWFFVPSIGRWPAWLLITSDVESNTLGSCWGKCWEDDDLPWQFWGDFLSICNNSWPSATDNVTVFKVSLKFPLILHSQSP